MHGCRLRKRYNARISWSGRTHFMSSPHRPRWNSTSLRGNETHRNASARRCGNEGRRYILVEVQARADDEAFAEPFEHVERALVKVVVDIQKEHGTRVRLEEWRTLVPRAGGPFPKGRALAITFPWTAACFAWPRGDSFARLFSCGSTSLLCCLGHSPILGGNLP